MPRPTVLPTWAKLLSPGKVEIDADAAYPELLKELGAEEVDRYWLVTAYECAKFDVRSALAGTEDAPKPGTALAIFVVAEDKVAWTIAGYPRGKGAATALRDFRQNYRRIRPGLI